MKIECVVWTAVVAATIPFRVRSNALQDLGTIPENSLMSIELERFDPAQSGGRISYEHVHRYALSLDRVSGRRALDLACGTGYGTALLAMNGAEVTGVDIDAGAIREAKKRYGQTGAKYLIADCYDLPFEAGTFDVVIANEMIEHVDDHDALLTEARRVLKPGGTFVVSTPNKPVYNRHKEPNRFHVSEMDIPQFRALLARHFSHVHMTGTRMALLSVGYDIDRPVEVSNLGAARIFEGSMGQGSVPGVSSGELWLEDAEYVLAACSDAAVELPESRSSIYYNRADDLWLEHEKIMSWASQLHQEDEDLRARVSEVEAGREELERDRSALAQRVDDLRSVAALAAASLESQRESIAQKAEEQSATLSRLLGRTLGSAVGQDMPSLIEGLFSLNEQVVLQRASLAEAGRKERELAAALKAATEDAQRKEETLRTVSAAAEAAAERSRALLDTAEERLSAKTRLAESLEGELTKSQETTRKVQAELAEFRNAKTQLEARLAKADKRLVDAEAIASSTAAELERTQQTLKDEQRAVVLLRAQLSAGHHASGSVERPGQSRGDAADPVRRNFILAHRRVRSALHVAGLAVREAAPATRVKPLKAKYKFQKAIGLPVTPLATSVFDGDWIRQQVPGAGRLTLARYLADTTLHRVSPHPLFDVDHYLRARPDIASDSMSALEHYLRHGWREGCDPHPYFRNDWYLHQNPDVLRSGGRNPLDHYLECGWREGRWPNPLFDPRAYLDCYPDVHEAGWEPLTHFVVHGKGEGREPPLRSLDSRWTSLLPAESRNSSLFDFLLTTEPPEMPEGEGNAASGAHGIWPPAPLNDFWPPQSLRDFFIEGYGNEKYPLYWYLYSVMAAYADDQTGFAASPACAALVDRVKALSAALYEQNRTPVASIIVPVYNNVVDTLLCLVSVLEHASDHAYEVIVADDGSTDATPALVAGIGDVVRYLRQPQNLGFLGNCNEAAKLARGKFVVLLNNDTLVLPGWLDGLLAPFSQRKRVGLVGSKLVNWDGTLQEAGGIFWRDGSAWNFGRGQNARAPEFNYLKDADYISGASIAVPTAVWYELGGFDPAFTPAYCEDSDLAFRLREAGYRTLYNPLSEVIHHEGRSHGRDVTSGIKAYQVANQQRLLDRWTPVLERDHFPNAENVLRARDRSFAKRHILIVDHYVPQFDRDAGSRTMFDFIKTLLDDNWAVTFWPDNLWRDPDYTPKLQELGVEVVFGVAYRNGFASFLRDRAGLYDVILLSRPHIAKDYVAQARAAGSAKLVYYGHDVHFRRMEAQALLEGTDPAAPEIARMRADELEVCNASQVVLYPSQEEADIMAGLVRSGTRSLAIPAYRYLDEEISEARARVLERSAGSGMLRLLFVGGFGHTPNVDGIKWFCNDIAPIMRSEEFAFHLDIVGSKAGEDIRGLAAGDINVLGFVSDEELLSLYKRADVVVAPLRYGAGVKGKVVEAIARGVPVVTTTVGAQGLDQTGRFLFVGDDAKQFANLVKEAAVWDEARQRALAALDFVQSHYSQHAMTQFFRDVL
ncbi:MAG: methyltransferase domain-containing protein [Novosphingobium sp.]|uniref:methyltransferase domain-containing protein n=1 Tax=Novosphingobium sp. TaxID=1874826 RepID=UPI003B9B8A4F